MFIDASGSLGTEHARDLRRTAESHRARKARSHRVRAFASRMQLGPQFNYRSR